MGKNLTAWHSAAVAMFAAHLVSVEIRDMSRRTAGIRSFAMGGKRTVIAVMYVEVVIHMAVKMPRPMEPRAGADEDAVVKPLRPVIAVRSTVVGSVIEVAVWTHWFRSVSHSKAHLDVVSAAEKQQQGRGNQNKPESRHK